MKTESKERKQTGGTLDAIRFQNDSGFIIGIFLDKANNRFSALGNILSPEVGLTYLLTGEWEENPKFGKQFKFSAYETVLPSDANGIFKYIVRICKFVGTSVGNTLVSKYGEDTLSIMKNEPERVAEEIAGITLDRAKEIQITLKENEINEKVMVELETMLDTPGMRKDLPTRLIKEYGSNAPAIVKKNPYKLTNFSGVGFHLADRVALNLGFDRDSIHRKEAATMHVITGNMQEGSTWIYKDDLLIKVGELIQVKNRQAGIESLLKNKVLVEKADNYALSFVDSDEYLIASTLACMGVL